MKEIILQHLIMPSSYNINDAELLYCRTHQTSFPVTLNPGEQLDLRTHFNMIPIRVLNENNIGDITIKIDIEGDAVLSLYIDNSDRPYFSDKINDSGFSLNLPTGELLGAVITAKGNCKIFGGYVSCHLDTENNVCLGLVICTYHREEIMVKKARIIDDYIKTNGLSDLLKMIIIDNGASFVMEDNEIIHSKNLGGSGGFTRGMMEAKRNGCTHVVLNDDDALFDPEILFRTISLLNIIGDKKIIGGTMLSSERPCVVYESGAVCNGPYLHSLKRNVDVSTIEGNTILSCREWMNYTGWWYSVFPVTLIEKIGYPLPFFYKEDDVEYGLRSDIEKITICGLSIWHPEPKYNPSVNYYYVRNHLATMASHGLLNRKSIRAFISKILLEISAYRYQGAEMMILGMNDFIRGPDYVYHRCKESPVTVKMNYHKLDSLRKNGDYTAEPPKSGFLIRLLTMNGLLLPSRGSTEKDVKDMKTKDFYRMGRILYSVNDSEGFIATRKRTRTISLVFRTTILWGCTLLQRKKLSKQYSQKLNNYSSEAKWIELYN